MASLVEYNEAESKRTEQAYLSPEIVRQRERTIELLGAVEDQHIVDVGCGPGLLAAALSVATGPAGCVTGIDASPAMIKLAQARCGELENVRLAEGDARTLPLDDESADAVICTQVLLYVADYRRAIAEMHRILKPGGRIFVLETDWRSAVLHSNDETLTEKIIAAWDRAVPSPRLPATMRPLLRNAGFESIGVHVIPNVSTSCAAGGFSRSMMEQCSQAACEQGVISAQQRSAWLDDLSKLAAADAYFFCVNRFLFEGVRPAAA